MRERGEPVVKSKYRKGNSARISQLAVAVRSKKGEAFLFVYAKYKSTYTFLSAILRTLCSVKSELEKTIMNLAQRAMKPSRTRTKPL